jgi:hypothetical protein
MPAFCAVYERHKVQALSLVMVACFMQVLSTCTNNLAEAWRVFRQSLLLFFKLDQASQLTVAQMASTATKAGGVMSNVMWCIWGQTR